MANKNIKISTDRWGIAIEGVKVRNIDVSEPDGGCDEAARVSSGD